MDLSELLEAWPFEPGKLNVRLITGRDGSEKLQIRLDLGVLQMDLDHRPDGKRPAGYDSVLEYFEALHDAETQGSPPPPPRSELGLIVEREDQPSSRSEEEAEESHDTLEPAQEPEPIPEPSSEPERFALSPADSKLVRDEAVQIYHRYVALLVLEDYDRVVRDTARNLRATDLLARHATTESDRQSMEPYRAYITMMQARALAGQALDANEPKAAVLAIEQALDALRAYFTDRGETEMFEEAGEVQALRAMRASLIPKLPVSLKTELQQRLTAAIESENYELAAILRDELGQIRD